MRTLLEQQLFGKRPLLPTRIIAGRRVEIGEACPNGSDWTWRWSVPRKSKARRQVHWVRRTRDGWGVSCDLWSQVRSRFGFVEFIDKDGGRWGAPVERLDALKKRLDLPLEEPHWLLPAEAWNYAAPPGLPLQLSLFAGAEAP